MKRLLSMLLFMTLTLSACAIFQANAMASSDLPRDKKPEISQSELDGLVTENNSFAFNFYHQVNSEKENFVYSPFSLSTAAAMLYGGRVEPRQTK
jgi:serpin B